MTAQTPDRPVRSTSEAVVHFLTTVLYPSGLTNSDAYYDLLDAVAAARGRNYDADFLRMEDLHDAIKAKLPTDMHATLDEFRQLLEDELRTNEVHACYEIGRRLQAAIDVPTPSPRGQRSAALERFLNAMQTVIGLDADADGLTREGLQRRVEMVRRAIPVARAILLTEHTLAGPGGCDVLDAFLHREEQAARREIPEPTDPDDECQRAAAVADATYLAGIAVGLLLADVV